MKNYYLSDEEFLFDMKQRGIILALDEYINNMHNIVLREAILTRYIVVHELDEEYYKNFMTLVTTDITEMCKCQPHKFNRVQKYWPDVVKDNIVSRVRFFLSEVLQEYSRYHYHDTRQISLILAQLP